ncbi:MAG: hypothetical protein ACRDRZ_13135 [Pseudonocardiaceae bacterium]
MTPTSRGLVDLVWANGLAGPGAGPGVCGPSCRLGVGRRTTDGGHRDPPWAQRAALHAELIEAGRQGGRDG